LPYAQPGIESDQFPTNRPGAYNSVLFKNHKIAIYPTETANFINQLKMTGNNFPEPTKGIKTP
jgi:hypothetical protein